MICRSYFTDATSRDLPEPSSFAFLSLVGLTFSDGACWFMWTYLRTHLG